MSVESEGSDFGMIVWFVGIVLGVAMTLFGLFGNAALLAVTGMIVLGISLYGRHTQ